MVVRKQMFPKVKKMEAKKIDPDYVYLVYLGNGEVEINCECHGACYYSIEDFLNSHTDDEMEKILIDD